LTQDQNQHDIGIDITCRNKPARCCLISISKNFGGNYAEKGSSRLLLFLVAVGASTLFAFVRGHLMSFSFLTTWHTA